MFSPALVCVCVSVATITKKIVDGFAVAPNFTQRFLGGKGRPSLCFVTNVRSVEGCGRNGPKLRKPAIVCKIAPSGNSKLSGRKIGWQVLQFDS